MVAVARMQDSAPDFIGRTKTQASLMRGLAAGLIVRCLEDLQHWERIHTRQTNKDTFRCRESIRAAYHAIRWLNASPHSERVTFVECCDMLSMNPSITRNRILAMIDGEALDAACEPPTLIRPGKPKVA